MSRLLYLDSSVLLSMVFPDHEDDKLRRIFTAYQQRGYQPVSSTLLRLEVRRVFYRNKQSYEGADEAVGWVNLLRLNENILLAAGRLNTHIRTLDSIHLANALALDDQGEPLVLWTLDRQMGRAAKRLGLTTVE